MSRNQYTKAVRQAQNAQILHQEEDLKLVARDPYDTCNGFPLLSVINELKERRRVRLARNKHHKSNHIKPTHG